MRCLPWLAAIALLPSPAFAQVGAFPPPGPGTPVEFVACPERTAGGSWVATDGFSGFTYSLADAPTPPANVYIRVSGVVSPALIDSPGWALTPIKVLVGRSPCRSAGVTQPWPSYGPWFPNVTLPRL